MVHAMFSLHWNHGDPEAEARYAKCLSRNQDGAARLRATLQGEGLQPGPLFQQRCVDAACAVLMGMVHVLFPYMVLPLYSVLQAIDRRLLLAAESLGATPARAFLQIYLPLALPGLIAGAMLVFVLALGFYITPAILGSPQQSLISNLIYSQFERTAAFGRAGAMALVLSIAALAVVALMAKVNRRNRMYGGTP
jgi:putative spermidine/putrescine transport system permease protein